MLQPNLSIARTRVHTSVAVLYGAGALRLTQQMVALDDMKREHGAKFDAALRQASARDADRIEEFKRIEHA